MKLQLQQLNIFDFISNVIDIKRILSHRNNVNKKALLTHLIPYIYSIDIFSILVVKMVYAFLPPKGAKRVIKNLTNKLSEKRSKDILVLWIRIQIGFYLFW